jgi:predicted Holliday junction resolvase-like endonuclease
MLIIGCIIFILILLLVIFYLGLELENVRAENRKLQEKLKLEKEWDRAGKVSRDKDMD